ncbi:hypothetical protein BWD42_09200 [Sphingobacterium sp. CZ-UAM]|jgi:hypothetical protein|uniref:hypothetical protein n=1 Tax=Sphingobacterium sp. CZ-UAM TaxID=1933868 RepID=UPI000985BC1D|nr:hypothetical protein [Sphingobacterium sp. CZ-UAM]OOG20038.1 hypothetical protein BWD42_09200 [Sphingobacterium sp. CZ-UAM]
MKRKTKLVFAELERELSIIPHYQMLSILGGGSVDTIDQVVQWASDMGIPFTVNGQSQYTDSNGNILLSPVDVYSWANNQNTGHNPYSTTTIPPAIPHEEDIKRSYIQYFESLGYEMIQNEDGSYYCASAPYQPDHDPWQRVNGEIVATRTQAPPFVYNGYNIAMNMEEYTLKTTNNENIKVYKVASVVDPITGQLRPPTEAESANCIGFALTGTSDYWIVDNPQTPQNQSDEGRITTTFLESTLGYERTTNKSEASFVAVFNNGEVIHAGIVDKLTGTYSAKGGAGEVISGMTSEAQFLQPDGPDGTSYAQGTVIYYK